MSTIIMKWPKATSFPNQGQQKVQKILRPTYTLRHFGLCIYASNNIPGISIKRHHKNASGGISEDEQSCHIGIHYEKM